MYLNLDNSDDGLPSYDKMFKSFKINNIEYVGTSINGRYKNLPKGNCTAVIEWRDGYNGPFSFGDDIYDYNLALSGFSDDFFKYIVPIGSLNGTFLGCQSLTSLDLSKWDTSNVTDMSWMFVGCYSLTSLDLSSWDVSNVTDMYNVFYNCGSLTSLDLSNWNTSNVTSMSGMFEGCTNLTEIRMGGDVSKVTNMGGMFDNISSTGTFY